MEINVQLTEDIVNKSLHLHYATAPAKQRYSILYLPAALLFIAAYFIITELNKHRFATNGWLGIVYIAMAVGYFLYMRYKREHTGKQLIKALGENSIFDMEVNNHEVLTKLSDSTLNHKWTAFHRAVMSDQLVLLYQPNQSFSMFDKSFFANDDFDSFRKMVKQHVIDIKEV